MCATLQKAAFGVASFLRFEAAKKAANSKEKLQTFRTGDFPLSRQEFPQDPPYCKVSSRLPNCRHKSPLWRRFVGRSEPPQVGGI